jgi:hypothetical protein
LPPIGRAGASPVRRGGRGLLSAGAALAFSRGFLSPQAIARLVDRCKDLL